MIAKHRLSRKKPGGFGRKIAVIRAICKRHLLSPIDPSPVSLHCEDIMSDYFTPHHPIRKVAVIGAGPSGVPAARHLLEAGLEVRVFERQAQAGGIWNFRPEVSYPLSVPTPPPSTGAFVPVLRDDGRYPVVNDKEGVERRFNPPNPCYWSLSNNVPTQTMAVGAKSCKPRIVELMSFSSKTFLTPKARSPTLRILPLQTTFSPMRITLG